jgi:hypothetical protein
MANARAIGAEVERLLASARLCVTRKSWPWACSRLGEAASKAAAAREVELLDVVLEEIDRFIAADPPPPPRWVRRARLLLSETARVRGTLGDRGPGTSVAGALQARPRSRRS